MSIRIFWLQFKDWWYVFQKQPKYVFLSDRQFMQNNIIISVTENNWSLNHALLTEQYVYTIEAVHIILMFFSCLYLAINTQRATCINTTRGCNVQMLNVIIIFLQQSSETSKCVQYTVFLKIFINRQRIKQYEMY